MGLEMLIAFTFWFLIPLGLLLGLPWLLQRLSRPRWARHMSHDLLKAHLLKIAAWDRYENRIRNEYDRQSETP